MKALSSLLILSLTLSVPAWAGPLQKNRIAGDAKWLLHVDLDNLRQTQLGEFLLTKFLSEHADGVKTGFHIDPKTVLEKVRSLTAYGSSYDVQRDPQGVLIIDTDRETQKILEGIVAAQLLQNPDGPLQQVKNAPFTLYSLNHELFVSPQPDGMVIAGKSQEQIERARKVLSGETGNLNSSKAFSGFAQAPDNFFFLGIAEAFNSLGGLPPQARILQMAQSARLVLGEKADKVFLNLVLQGRDSDVNRQIQQVIEGMIALVSLGQKDNKDLFDLAQGTKVVSDAKTVTVGIDYPVTNIMARLRESDQPRRSKKKKTAAAPAAEKSEFSAPASNQPK